MGKTFTIGRLSGIQFRLHFTWFDGLWITAIGWFLKSAASNSYNQIERKTTGNNFTIPVKSRAEGRISAGPVSI